MRIKYVLCFVLLVFAVLFCLNAQEDENWYYGKPIRDIKFDGLVNVSSTDVIPIVNRYIGKVFSDEIYSEILSKIYALELFTDDIEPTAVAVDEKKEAVVLRFKVIELPIVTKIEYRGNSTIRKMELDETISIKTGDVYNKAKVLMSERAIRDLYLAKGYTNIKVSSTINERESDTTIMFKITEGNLSIITAINFEGNQVVNSKTLKGEMELSEKKPFKDGAFEEVKLEQDKYKILDYYQNRGYADAQILDVRRDIKPNEEKKRDEITLTFVIREGILYSFGGIEIIGNTIFDTETLMNLVRIKQGTMYNKLKIQESFMAISDLYYENGYTSNQFIPQAKKDVENRNISYVLQIVERERSHIEKVILRGNAKTKDYVILREIPLESGDIFSKAKVTNGLRNLFNTQYFSSIIPDIQPGSEENLVNLILNLEEQSTTSVEFGVTFSGVTEPGAWPISFFAKWQDSNLFGTGKTISANVEVSKTKQAVGLGFSQRWLFAQPITFSLNANIEHSNATALQKIYLPTGFNDEDYFFSYQNWVMSIGASLGRCWTPDFAIFSVSGGFSSSLLRNIYDNDLYTPYDDSISEYHGDWGFGNTVFTSFSVDDRDISYDPNKGWFASQRLSWTGLMPFVETQFFFRSDTKAEGYVTLFDIPVTKKWNFKMILALYSGFSFILPTRNTKLSQRNSLYIDGMFNGRGWSSTEYYNFRGAVLWSNIVELRMPVVPGVLAIDIFMDAITLQNHITNMNMDIENWRFSFGPGLRFCLPQFPIRFLFSNTFKIKNGQVEWGVNGKSGRPDWQFVLSFNLTNN